MRNEAMSLLNRYVYAVRKYLPRTQRNDIASELREILQSQVDDEEAANQRPLTDNEIGQILKRYGHPRDVAARYGSHQYLIGPEVFPSYVAAIRVLFWVLAPVTLFMVLTTTLLAEEHTLEQIAKTLWSMVSIGLVNLTLLTLVFAYLGRMQWAGLNDWDPDELPEVQANPKTPIQRSETIGSLLSLILLLAWWLGINSLAARWFGWPTLPFSWTAVWTDVSYAAVAVIAAGIARELMGLIRPRWTRLYVGTGALLDLAALFVLVRLLKAGTYLSLNAAVDSPLQMLASILDKFIFAILIVGAVGTMINAIWLALRLFRMEHDLRAIGDWS